MNKSDFIKAFAHEINVTPTVGRSIIETILDKMSETLIQGDNIEIRGFGSFTIKNYEGYEGRNPKTGVVAIIKPKKLPFFKPGKALRESVNSTRRTVSKAKNKK